MAKSSLCLVFAILARCGHAAILPALLAKYTKNLSAVQDISIKNGEYTLTITCVHPPELPAASGAADCNTSAPAMAADGFPFLMSRQMYVEPTDAVTKATGFKGLGFDWQPCGHPHIKHFGAPHLDLHFYYKTKSERDTWTCELVPGAPICAPPPYVQPSQSGKNFFVKVENVSDGNFTNMPAGYEYDVTSGIQTSGIHYWHSKNAAPVANWHDPTLVMGGYAGEVVFWEPMIPISFIRTSRSIHQDFTYTSQTMSHLPSSLETVSEVQGSDVKITLVIKGKAISSGATTTAISSGASDSEKEEPEGSGALNLLSKGTFLTCFIAIAIVLARGA